MRHLLSSAFFIAIIVQFAPGQELLPDRYSHVRSVSVQKAHWFIFQGDLYHVDESFAKTSKLSSNFRYWSGRENSSENYRSEFDSSDYPNMQRWTSKTTPLVQGRIKFVETAKDGRVWMVNGDSEVSIFDGTAWETISRMCVREQHDRYCFETAKLYDDVLRVVNCGGIVDVSLETGRKTQRFTSGGWGDAYVMLRLDKIAQFRGRYLHGIIDVDDNTLRYHVSDGLSRDDADTIRSTYRTTRVATAKLLIQELQNSHFSNTSSTCPVAHDSDEDGRSCGLATMQPDPDAVRVLIGSGIIEEISGWMCGTGLSETETVYDITSDNNGTIFLATSMGVVVLPDTAGGIAEKRSADDLSLSLSPNPASNLVRVSLASNVPVGTTISVLDITGRVVFSITNPESVVVIDVSRLSVGSYQVVVSSAYARTTRQLYVMK